MFAGSDRVLFCVTEMEENAAGSHATYSPLHVFPGMSAKLSLSGHAFVHTHALRREKKASTPIRSVRYSVHVVVNGIFLEMSIWQPFPPRLSSGQRGWISLPAKHNLPHEMGKSENSSCAPLIRMTQPWEGFCHGNDCITPQTRRVSEAC